MDLFSYVHTMEKLGTQSHIAIVSHERNKGLKKPFLALNSTALLERDTGDVTVFLLHSPMCLILDILLHQYVGSSELKSWTSTKAHSFMGEFS